MKVWEVEIKHKDTAPGGIYADWQGFLFSSKAKAQSAAALWLYDGFTISGPRPRIVR